MYTTRQIIAATLASFPATEHTQKMMQAATPVTGEVLLATFRESVGEAINLAIYAADDQAIDFLNNNYNKDKPRPEISDPPSAEDLKWLKESYKSDISYGVFSFLAIAKKCFGELFLTTYEVGKDKSYSNMLVSNINRYAKTIKDDGFIVDMRWGKLGEPEASQVNSEVRQYLPIIKLMGMAVFVNAREALIDNKGVNVALNGWCSVTNLGKYYKQPAFGVISDDAKIIENYVVDNFGVLEDGTRLIKAISSNLGTVGSDVRTVEVIERVVANIDNLADDLDLPPRELFLYLQAAKAGLNKNIDVRQRALAAMDAYFNKFLTTEESIRSRRKLFEGSLYGSVAPKTLTAFLGKPEYADATPSMVYEVLRRINNLSPSASDPSKDPSGVLSLPGDEKVAAKALSYFVANNVGAIMKIRDSIDNAWQEGVVGLVVKEHLKTVSFSLVDNDPSL
jgi:hypothetical protein